MGEPSLTTLNLEPDQRRVHRFAEAKIYLSVFLS